MSSRNDPLPLSPATTSRRHPVVLHGGDLSGLYAMLPTPAPDVYDHRMPDGRVLRYNIDPLGRVARYHGDVTDVYHS